MIELIGFTKIYSQKKGEAAAVQDVSFVCERGKVTGLVGENGSGKSTIIKAITGFHYPTKGQVFIYDRFGNKINVAEHPEEAKKITGYVPEVSILPGNEKLSDLFKFLGSIYGVKDFSTIVSKCSLDSVMDKKVGALSKGYKQRAAFGLCLLNNPSVIVLDEPNTGLDPAQIIQMRQVILEESKDKTILLSTHILQEVHSICSSVHVMKNGRLSVSGTEEEIIKKTDSKSFEEAFLKL